MVVDVMYPMDVLDTESRTTGGITIREEERLKAHRIGTQL
jgi:hypothetical protein